MFNMICCFYPLVISEPSEWSRLEKQGYVSRKRLIVESIVRRILALRAVPKAIVAKVSIENS